MTVQVAGLFPGQGSQIVGMGSDLAKKNEEARELFQRADKALGFSLSTLCFEGPLDELTLTQHAQPAILVTSYVCFKTFAPKLAAAAGHSLGEYTALVAAGALGFEEAVQLVYKRGTYMQEAVPAGKGKMIAVLGPSEEEIRAALGEMESGTAEIANLNCPGQTVIAGDVEGVDRFSAIMKEKGARIMPLNVSAPFHCRLMDPAAKRLSADLDAISFTTPQFPVYANVTAEPVTGGDGARAMLKKQVCSTVRWTESMLNMIAGEKPAYFIEFGAGSVLSNLMKRIDKSIACLSVSDSASAEKVRMTTQASPS